MTMKSAVSSLFLASLLEDHRRRLREGAPAPEKASDANRAAILAVLTAQQSDWNKGNIRGFMQGYWNSSELTFCRNRRIYAWVATVMTRYEKSYADIATMGTLDFFRTRNTPAWTGCGACAGKMAFAAASGRRRRHLHTGFSEISRRLAYHSRPHDAKSAPKTKQ